MSADRVQNFAEDADLPADAGAGERAIAELVRKTVFAPARLQPSDLDDVAREYGATGAVDIVGYLHSFHYINRIADLVGIRSDLPLIQERWPWLRRLGVRLQAKMMRTMLDLSHREVQIDVDAVLARLTAVMGPLPKGFASLHLAPNVAGLIGSICEIASKVDANLLVRIGESVRTYLPTSEGEVHGIHERPKDPLEALVFVGTRYAARTTDDLAARVRAAHGYGDREMLDLFYARAVHTGLERMRRLLATPLRAAPVPRALPA
jgi:hypothetical protein